jgi:hypothetical protein
MRGIGSDGGLAVWSCEAKEQEMLKILAAVLFATSIYAGPAGAHGGGGAETMPGTNFTDMPSYRPRPAKPQVWIKPARAHVQWLRRASHRN